MKLDVEVGLGPGHIVLDEHLAPTPQIFGPCLFWPNGWLDQNATWPRRHCVRWGPITPKRGDISPPTFLAHVLWPNCQMDHDATWYRIRPWPTSHCVTWGPSCPPEKGAQPPTQIFGPCLLWPNGRPSQLLLSTCNVCAFLLCCIVSCIVCMVQLEKHFSYYHMGIHCYCHEGNNVIVPVFIPSVWV